VDAFTIKRIAGHSSITVSERYVHPSDDAMERAFERLEAATLGNVTNGDATVSATLPEPISDSVM
jgi:hypothetical protein